MHTGMTAVLLIVAALALSAGIGVIARIFVVRAGDPLCAVKLMTSRSRYRLGDQVHGAVEISVLQKVLIHSVTVSLLGVARPDRPDSAPPKDGEFPVFRDVHELGSPREVPRGGRLNLPFRLSLPSDSTGGMGGRRAHEERLEFTVHASVHCKGIDVNAVKRIIVVPEPQAS